MNPKDFKNLAAEQPILTKTGYWAFMPAPLPANLNWTAELIQALAEAERDLSRLNTMARSFPFLRLLIQPFVRREAVLSSRIEGTRASLIDLYNYESAQISFLEADDDVREVHNYVNALEFGIDRLQTLPVSLRLFGELHDRLMENVRGGQLTPGEFRRSQNWIGPAGSTLNTATYVPPPVDEMNTCLDQMEKFIHAGQNIPNLAQAAMLHYQFEAIHPFLDGNGRVGRLMIVLLFCEWGLLEQPLLNMSVYFERYRQEYYDRLLSISQNGEWEAWTRFFLRGVSIQANDSIVRLDKLQELRSKYQRVAESGRNQPRMEIALDFLFMRPILSIRQLENGLGLNFVTAKRYIEKLVKTGILTEVTGHTRNRMFRAVEILKALDDVG